MSLDQVSNQQIVFFPPSNPPQDVSDVGFRFGNKGTHSSRTMMLMELGSVLNALPSNSKRNEYATAIIENNCLQKPTVATRRLTNQRPTNP
jgi:hypothetical protein